MIQSLHRPCSQEVDLSLLLERDLTEFSTLATTHSYLCSMLLSPEMKWIQVEVKKAFMNRKELIAALTILRISRI